MLGFKIFDNDSEEILNDILLLANEDNLAIEVALYNNESCSFLSRMLTKKYFINNKNKSIHLNYDNYLVNNIKEEIFFSNMIDELEITKQLGIDRCVIHYQSPKNYQTHLKELSDLSLRANLKILHNVAKSYNFIMHIENTFIHKSKDFHNDLKFHRIIWDTIINLGLQDHLGICLDWGHVKSFSNDSLEIWLNYIEHLKNHGVPIYMHIHDNNGQKDQHLSLKQSKELNLKQFNHPTDKDFLLNLKDISNKYKNEPLILEYSSLIAKNHYLWTKKELSLI